MLDADLLHLATLTLAMMKLRGETQLGVWPLDGNPRGLLASPTLLANYWAELSKPPDSYRLACILVGWEPTLDDSKAER